MASSFIRASRALLLGFALVLSACDSGSDADTVTASGTLQNTFGRPIDGATLTFTGGGESETATTTASGGFSLQIPPGTYTLAISHPNYTPSTATVTITGGGAFTLTLSPLLGPGGLQALVVNALNGQGIPNSTIQCSYRRPDGSYPAPPAFDFSATTDASGEVTVTGTPYGPMRCVATTPFGAQAFDVVIASTGTTTAPPVAAVPLPASGQYRVVLTWGTEPDDLDSHLTGPDGSGGRFHVYYANETFGDTNLDLDDTSGEGPETTTISVVSGGMYRFSVHNYDDQSASGAQGIASSPATVRVYGPTGLLKTYTAPAATSGNTWRVFELTVSGSSATFNDGNGAGLGYVTASSPSDVGTFLTGGPGETPAEKGGAR